MQSWEVNLPWQSKFWIKFKNSALEVQIASKLSNNIHFLGSFKFWQKKFSEQNCNKIVSVLVKLNKSRIPTAEMGEFFKVWNKFLYLYGLRVFHSSVIVTIATNMVWHEEGVSAWAAHWWNLTVKLSQSQNTWFSVTYTQHNKWNWLNIAMKNGSYFKGFCQPQNYSIMANINIKIANNYRLISFFSIIFKESICSLDHP